MAARDDELPKIRRVSDAREIVGREIRARLSARSTPLVVAFDGASGAGKSTLAVRVAKDFDAALVQSDDFYAAHVPDAEWDAMSAAERAASVLDWPRLRSEALEPLLAGRAARWHTFDFEAGTLPDGTYAMREEWTERAPADVIVLDGAYSTSPALADLIDLSVLVDLPIRERHARLAVREDAEFLAGWHARWDVSEAHYFGNVRPPSAFDLVVSV
jgi:uridine kinase